MSGQTLSPANHDRDNVGLTYVYPVVSRRANGVSIGINLNTSNACNWRCIYCQVPDLKRGSAPPVDLAQLEMELRGFLDEAQLGDFMLKHVPESARRLNDIALSGNGEPTSAREFEQVIALIGQVLADFDLAGRIKLILITNGSLMHRQNVRNGLVRMAQLNGEVWFKLDSATEEGRFRLNHSRQSAEIALKNLRACAKLCPTWIQTALFELDGKPPSEKEIQAYLAFLENAKTSHTALQGVMLYGLARPSLQVEAPRLSNLPPEWVETFSERVEALGLKAKLSF
ncbi:MAG: radical SAM protein [Sulfuricellaceae bacterium]|nr:radical SAM protein [Sulfuricellaceae bacterium]